MLMHDTKKHSIQIFIGFKRGWTTASGCADCGLLQGGLIFQVFHATHDRTILTRKDTANIHDATMSKLFCFNRGIATAIFFR